MSRDFFKSALGDLGTHVKNVTTDDGQFITAYVIDYVSNPADLSKEKFKDLFGAEITANDIIGMPRNTIFAYQLNRKQNLKNQRPYIVLPFFSHIVQPIKPGELIWCIKDFDGQLYWLSRKHSLLSVEYLNYTCETRLQETLTDNVIIKTTKQTADKFNSEKVKEDVSSKPISFPPITAIKTDALKQNLNIFNASAISDFTGEPIPRASTRSPDLSLHGSNNTMILLGEDRDTDNLDEEGRQQSRGAIDLVVGRGQTEKTSAIKNIENVYGYNEINKDTRSTIPGENDKKTEGDIDFKNDSARIFISMNSIADQKLGYIDKFGTSLDFFNINHGHYDSATSDAVILPKSCIIIKADENRIISKYGGSLLLKREGKETSSGDNETEQTNIELCKEGNIHLRTGDTGIIYLGENVYSQPAVLGHELIAHCKYLSQILKEVIIPSPVGPLTLASATTGGANPMNFNVVLNDWENYLDNLLSDVVVVGSTYNNEKQRPS